MSSMIQFSMNNEREIQWTRFVQKRPELQNLGQTDAIKRVLFDAMDAVVPISEKEGS